MILLFWIGVFIISLFVVYKSSDLFIDSSEKVGIALHIPDFIIGVTIFSIGTSLPELLTSIVAMYSGQPEIVVGNVVGSNITNILFGLGLLPILVGFFVIDKKLISTDLPILIGSTFLLLVTCYDGKFVLIEALFCLAGFVLYIAYAMKEHREYKKQNEEHLKETAKLEVKTIVALLLSCFLLWLGAEFTIKSLIKISSITNIATEVVSASALALGTSLPEIITSIMVIRHGKIDIAVGTLLGSNIFNAFGIMGITGLMGTIIIPANMLPFGIGMLVLATLLSFFITLDQEITVWEGWLLIIFYGGYILKLYNLI
jgi:cation:H+ antiporter